MKASRNFKFTKNRIGDFITYCDTCGCMCWASETIQLHTYSGEGNIRVCLDDYDKIDYGLVPYKIPAEKPVPFARDTVYVSNPQNIPQTYSPFNAALLDPMSYSPQAAQNYFATWDQLNLQTWDQWNVLWGTDPNYDPEEGQQ